MAMMTVYHGGYQVVEKPEIRKGRNTKDFGTGFYCTVIKEQAQRWAKRYDTKVVSIYDVRLNSDLNIKEFKEMTEEWLDFIVACRSGQNHDYDIVIGAMADDQIYNYISDYIDGVLTREQFWVLARFKYPIHQIVFCTDAALKCLEYRNCVGSGRESRKDNDLFFTCGLIDYIARKTKNVRADVVNQLGKKRIEKIYDLADVYHCENIDQVSDDFIEEAQIKNGTFDNVAECKYAIPSHWDIGKVYKRLIKQVAEYENISIVDALMKVYNSFLAAKIDDYNSSVYYENPSYLFESYRENKML